MGAVVKLFSSDLQWKRFYQKKMDKSVSESDKDNEEFTIIDEGDLDDLLNGPEDELKHIIDQIDDLKLDLNQSDIKEVVTELRHLEEKLHLWREVRTKTISELREIADYIDKISKQTGIAKVVGSGGGVLAGGLTLAGGVMTVVTAGAALPVLAAGAGLGLASGITGASAALSKNSFKQADDPSAHCH